jgi:hypothetical protein
LYADKSCRRRGFAGLDETKGEGAKDDGLLVVGSFNVGVDGDGDDEGREGEWRMMGGGCGGEGDGDGDGSSILPGADGR